MRMDKEQIKKIIPHRAPMLLIDEVVELNEGKSVKTAFFLDPELDFFKGHFPGEPVMPGVLLVEALAQTGAVAALSLPENRGKLAIFGGVKNARFKQPVRPGDVLELSCELVEQHGPVGFGKAAAKVDGKLAARCELTFVIQ